MLWRARAESHIQDNSDTQWQNEGNNFDATGKIGMLYVILFRKIKAIHQIA